jgi:endonuclease/exonuclease/phosphatase family metal-dependent hydrolase
MMSMSNRKARFALLLLLTSPWLTAIGGCSETDHFAAPRPDSGDYLLCFWNLENFFDDREDGRINGADKEYDVWFARDHHARELKLEHLTRAILELNGGRGPDILCVAEVESQRALELLQESLNKRLSDAALHYAHTLFKEVASGRHIGTGILTRLPVERERTQVLGKRLRILEGHITVNGHPLVLVASHWTSRLTDEAGAGRDKYADQVYGRFRAMYTSNPHVDFLVCGDFNDSPEDESVTRHLHASAIDGAVRTANEGPRLYDLMAGKDPHHFGTHYYKKWLIFDHIVVSPGLLDSEGWSVVPDSVKTINTLTNPHDKQQRPWRFGSEKDKGERGYSDHFPVTVRLQVH